MRFVRVLILLAAIISSSGAEAKNSGKVIDTRLQVLPAIPKVLQGEWVANSISRNKGINMEVTEPTVVAIVSDNTVYVPSRDEMAAIKYVALSKEDKHAKATYYIRMRNGAMWEANQLKDGLMPSLKEYWVVVHWTHDGESLVETERFMMKVSKP